jgi:hypothetical protein
VDDETRVVNATLQDAGIRRWGSHTVSQDEPQHGLWVRPVEEIEGGLLGIARPVRSELMGPPKLTTVVEIRKPAPVPAPEGIDPRLARFVAGNGVDPKVLDWTLRHELGHAVGIPHHSDTVEEWRVVSGRLNVTTRLSPLQGDGGVPDFSILGSGQTLDELAPDLLLVEPGPECGEEDDEAVQREDTFAGCLTATIVRRGQQNSGDASCPMRYRGDSRDRYEAPGSTAHFVWSGEVVKWGYSNWGGAFEIGRFYVDAWGGRLLRYQAEHEQASLGRFCTSVKGTGINDLPGDQNHAGDAGRDEPCAGYLVVRDAAASGVP